jgi:acyl carrier protein
MAEQIRRLIADVMGADESELGPSLTVETVGGWDSLHHFQLMLALETEFGVTVRSEDMTKLTSDEAIERYVQQAKSHA